MNIIIGSIISLMLILLTLTILYPNFMKKKKKVNKTPSLKENDTVVFGTNIYYDGDKIKITIEGSIKYFSLNKHNISIACIKGIKILGYNRYSSAYGMSISSWNQMLFTQFVNKDFFLKEEKLTKIPSESDIRNSKIENVIK